MLTEEKFDKNKHIFLAGDFSSPKEIMEIYIKDLAFKEYVFNHVDIYLVFEEKEFIGYYGIKNREIIADDQQGK